MSLMTGRHLLRDWWTELPMPQDAITRVGSLGRQPGMPKTLTFADRFGFELPDGDDDVDDDHDSTFVPSDDGDSDDDASFVSATSSHSSDSDDDDDDDDADRGDEIAQPLPGLTAGVNDINIPDHDDNDSDADDDDNDNEDDGDEDDNNDDDGNEDDDDTDNPAPEINIPDTVVSTPPTGPSRSTGVGGRNTGVGIAVHDTQARNTGVGADSLSEENNAAAQAMNERYGARQHDINLRDRKPRNYNHLYDSDHLLATFEEPMGELFMTEQMSLKKGLKYFGKKGADAVVSEMRQLDYRNVITPVDGKELTREQKRRALNYLMYLKQKRCGHQKLQKPDLKGFMNFFS
jgi:hypothetical protein